jgi:hypothetical protein
MRIPRSLQGTIRRAITKSYDNSNRALETLDQDIAHEITERWKLETKDYESYIEHRKSCTRYGLNEKD